jgi:hypothetical protein
MFFRTLIEKLKGARAGRPPRKRGAAKRRVLGTFRLGIEALEDRQLLSISTAITLDNVFHNTVHFDDPVRLVAHVTTTPPSGRGSGPTGTVQFVDNTDPNNLVTLGTADLARRGIARLSVDSLAVGTHSIIATYVPASGTDFSTSTSTPLTETVETAPTNTVLLALGNPALDGTTPTFTATVSAAGDHWGRHWGHDWTDQAASDVAPTGTVTFTIDGGTAMPGTLVTDTGGKAVFTFTPSQSLTVGTHTVVATYSGDSNYDASTSHTLTEQIVAPVAGSVKAGDATAPLGLRGGDRTFSVDVTQDTSTPPVATGTVTYADPSQGISLTSTAITSVVFSSNGHQAEITGVGTNTNSDGTTTANVSFTMVVNSGTQSGWHGSRSSVSVVMIGDGIDYRSTARLASGGTITIDGTGTTRIPPVGSWHDQALQDVLGDWGQFGFHNWHREGRWG